MVIRKKERDKALSSILISLLLAICMTAVATLPVDAVTTQDKRPTGVKWFNSYKSLGKYMDKAIRDHKKKIVFYSEKDNLFEESPSSDPRSNIYVLEDYSFMLFGTKTFFEDINMEKYQSVNQATDSAGESVKDTWYKYTVEFSYVHGKKNDKKFYNKVRSVAKKAKKEKGTVKKVKYINDYLIKNVRWGDDNYESGTAYTALMHKTATCEGYSAAFAIIAKEAGLKADIVTGQAWNRYTQGSSNKGYHAWNVVKVGKKWRLIDVTFNDQTGKYKNKYLLIGKKIMSKDHKLRPYFKKGKWAKAHPLKK